MATITFQNLFRLYKKLAGMTGTADTEAAEFHTTYKLDVVAIPTNKHDPAQRRRGPRLQDRAREVHGGRQARSSSATRRASPCSSARPASRRATRHRAHPRRRRGIPHNVLNAKHHENEAYVVAQAGRKGAITVSTNMAGRGTDIMLGGNPEMLAQLEFKEQSRDARGRARGVRRSSSRSYEASCKAEHDEVRRARRPAHRRHRAPRVAPHRQPAARPRRPPGRPGLSRASTCRSKTT